MDYTEGQTGHSQMKLATFLLTCDQVARQDAASPAGEPGDFSFSLIRWLAAAGSLRVSPTPHFLSLFLARKIAQINPKLEPESRRDLCPSIFCLWSSNWVNFGVKFCLWKFLPFSSSSFLSVCLSVPLGVWAALFSLRENARGNSSLLSCQSFKRQTGKGEQRAKDTKFKAFLAFYLKAKGHLILKQLCKEPMKQFASHLVLW